MNEIDVVFSESDLKILEIDGERWIKATDVARALDYKNPTVAAGEFIKANSEILYKGVSRFRTPSRGGDQDTWFFNSRGLMAFLVKSNRPKAVPFQKWAIGVLDDAIKKKMDLPKQYNSVRLKSKKIRREFTDTLKDHGYKEGREYKETTYAMKTILGIEKHRPKNELDIWELCKISMAEMLSITRLDDSTANGFSEVLPIT